MNKLSQFFLLAAVFLGACAPAVNFPLTETAVAEPTLSADCPLKAPENLPLAAPADLYGKQPLTGAQGNVGDFIFQFWLYCDPALQPDAQGAAYSAIPGLGLFASWRYDGPQMDGQYSDFYGFESDIFQGTGWDGPLYRARSGYSGGMAVSAESAQKYLQNGQPFQYHVGLQTPSGKEESVFSFTVKLEQGLYRVSAVTETH